MFAVMYCKIVQLVFHICMVIIIKNLCVLRMLSLWNVLPELTVKSNATTAFKLCLLHSNFDKYLRFI